jgi:hypothetical protein
MRTTPILTVTATIIAIASTGAAYYFLRDNALPRPVEAAKPSISSTASLNVQNTPMREERRDQPANPEQQRLTLMNDKIADLEARLRDMEAAASEQAKDPTISRPDEPEANNGAEKAKAKKLSEDDFGHWLDDALVTGDFNRDTTKLTMEEIETSLAEMPGLNLADMQCGARFCRASFVSENGKPPNISQLIGASSFIDSGFTINEPDGRVKVYFTQPGQSLSELRSEAQESVLGDMPPK